MENIFQKYKIIPDTFSYGLQHDYKYGWLHTVTNKKSTCRVNGDVCFMCLAKVLLYSFSIWYWWLENDFLQVKNIADLFTYVLPSSIMNMTGNIFSQKINFCNEWWFFLHVSSQSFVIYCSCSFLMENYFWEVKKTTDSLSYDL